VTRVTFELLSAKMNKLRNKILSIFLIPIVLFSTMSFNIDKHLCMDDIYSYSIFGQAVDCGMEMNTCDEKTSSSCAVVDEDCCSNENQTIAASVIDVNAGSHIDIEQINFLTYFIVSKYYLFKSNLNNSTSIFKYYSPPKVIKNISVLFQIFKI